MTAAQVDPRRQRAAAIAAQIRPLRGLEIGPDAVIVLRHWLSHYSELMTQRYGAPPDGLAETQYEISEYLAAGGDYSRQREQNRPAAPAFIGLGGEAVMTVAEAAEYLDRKPDSVRCMCREGRLAAKRQGRQWFPMLAAVQELKARREDT